mmetsp:Transcript_40819/g.98440  ORF Transcript_40819/g.98440 Transcript_40819/m.98440 type:complete len:494 (+) Transcript_40819:87-1568(+)
MSSHHDALNVSGMGNRERGPKTEHLEEEEASSGDKAYDITQFILQMMKKDSRFFPNNPSEALPIFEASEVSLEKNLGQGEFGVVFSISAFHAHVEAEEASPENGTNTTHDESEIAEDIPRMDHEISSDPHDTPSVQVYFDGRIGQKDTPPGLQQQDLDLLLEPNVSKGYMRAHVMRDGISRYAVKRLKKSLKDNALVQATADLAGEANFLKSLRHPNICKMRGTIGEPGKQGFAIVMDRLTITLREKMLEWKKLDDSSSLLSKLTKVLGSQSQSMREEKLVIRKEIYGEKLLAAYDVARALRHLAEHSIVFRDLKPENLAFDLRGDLRLFDFGLAKELKEKDMTAPGMYHLTGMTGSRRYMAPEVIMRKDYGLAVDIYSCAILIWEMMSNRNAYSYLNREKHFEMVVQRKKRPNLKMMISKKVVPRDSNIHALVKESWSHDPRKRPGIEKICDTLFSEIMSASNEEGSRVTLDRSTHLAAGSLKSRLDEPLWC